MVEIGKSKEEARPKGWSQRLKEDWISELPYPLISQILSLLSTKEVVCTSVLSTRWRSLWFWVPELNVDFDEFPDFNAFVGFCDSFFDSNRLSCIRKLNLDIEGGVNGVSFRKSWIDAAVKRKIQHMYVRCPLNEYLYEMPISIFTCETLVFLKLEWVIFPADAEVVFSLPCIKTMHLIKVLYPSEATFERLVSSCPVLEDLAVFVVRNDPKFYRVHSRSLKKLMFIRISTVPLDPTSGAEVDAPLLSFLSLYDDASYSFVVNNMESNAKLEISLDLVLGDFDEATVPIRRSRIRSFLPGISRVGDMMMIADTFKAIRDYSKLEPLPQFGSLSRLHINLCVSDLKYLPTFLESCPDLKALILALKHDEEMNLEEMNQFSYLSVPECLSSSLEFVCFKAPISGYAAEMELVKYFLENSEVLDRLVLRVKHDYDIFKELLKIPRCSTSCQVVVI